MDNMNKSSEGGEGNLLCVDDEMDPSQSSKMMKSSYVGESSRPIRARVREHINNLRCGSSKSFIISHWMDKHSASIEAPVFKWEILASYTDALRRQLGEGLYIMEAGGLNRRDEFNHNLICRMSPVMNEPMSEKELKSELERKRLYRDRLKMFIVDMSRKSNVMDKMKIQKKMYGEDANDMLCSRSIPPDIDKTPPINKKRGRDNMDTSTPVNVRRETKLLDLEDSPIDIEPQNSSQGCSGANDYSDETIPTSKTKAGLSNEVDTMAVTPPPVISPDTMDRRLMLHSIDIIKASEKNDRVTELHEGVDHTLSIGLNAFARRSDGTIGAGAVLIDVDSNEGKKDERSVVMDGMNKDPLGGDKGVRSVVMDEMNKDPLGGGMDARSAVMDGC